MRFFAAVVSLAAALTVASGDGGHHDVSPEKAPAHGDLHNVKNMHGEEHGGHAKAEGIDPFKYAAKPKARSGYGGEGPYPKRFGHGRRHGGIKHCTPRTYRCHFSTKGWEVCNVSGYWEFAGYCDYTNGEVCKFYKKSPYCVPLDFHFPQ